MKTLYDFVYLTNTPSFYKLNLCEAIARRGYKLLIVLYGYGAEAVNTQLGEAGCWSFDYSFINEGDSNTRNKAATFVRLLKLMHSIKARKVLYAGWLAPEYNLYAFLSDSRKNVVICESTWWDISLSGIAGRVKRSIIGRMSAALPTGKPHSEFFRRIGFKGSVEPTGSVGILCKPMRTLDPAALPSSPLRYICVARLIECKNLRFLVEQFNASGLPLTIVGKGPLEAELKAMAGSNVKFAGFVDNARIGAVYQSHDVFILPSTYEAWGLVVEEALYWGLPVIVSDKVGAAEDMVSDLHTGAIFRTGDAASFARAIEDVSRNYTAYHERVAAIDWQRREDNQVNAYIKLLEQ